MAGRFFDINNGAKPGQHDRSATIEDALPVDRRRHASLHVVELAPFRKRSVPL
jgi:hypothetical protein